MCWNLKFQIKFYYFFTLICLIECHDIFLFSQGNKVYPSNCKAGTNNEASGGYNWAGCSVHENSTRILDFMFLKTVSVDWTRPTSYQLFSWHHGFPFIVYINFKLCCRYVATIRWTTAWACVKSPALGTSTDGAYPIHATTLTALPALSIKAPA